MFGQTLIEVKLEMLKSESQLLTEFARYQI